MISKGIKGLDGVITGLRPGDEEVYRYPIEIEFTKFYKG